MVLFIICIILLTIMCYLSNKYYLSSCALLLTMSFQCLLLYIFENGYWGDTLAWLIISDIVDIIICICFIVRFPSKVVIATCVVTIIAIVYNINSYLNSELVSFELRTLLTDYYIVGLIMLIRSKNKTITVCKYLVPVIGLLL